MLNRSWAPTPFKGFETSPSTEGPIRAPAATSTTIWGSLSDGRDELRDQPGTQHEAEVAEDMLYVHPLADEGY